MTIDEIAKRAKVSRATVSLALNGKPGVSKETRNHVLSIARELGYIKRNTHRKSEKGNKIVRLTSLPNRGFLTDSFSEQPFFSSLLGYIEAACRDRGYGLMYSTVGHDHVAEGLLELESLHPAEGIIVLGTNLSKSEAEEICEHPDLRNRVVMLDVKYDDVAGNFVVMNNKLGARQAAEHLFQYGHRSIGYVRSNVRIHNFLEREEGFLAAAQALGLGNCTIFEAEPSLFSPQEDFVRRFVSALERPTALFCECDYIAVSVARALMRVGLSIPHDVSIVGFDDIPETELLTPPLTTVQVPRQLLGELCVSAIIDGSPNSQRTATQKIMLDTNLISRKSVRFIQL
ncbi:LacI family DNA-binding transcriptional regulator [Alicyclobacillus vulcanalis]|uniref:Transcriptional regulator, LacI family n=1 Tax=Alicyclobacillus vulcanalis TaxID=252246 RepID=A0A1N7PGD1_9BACL|nr:LacI family DNA-binding transcriptional regulator [Alicyclobacillus vulcanalis]SIT09586.1 transcriptional regulator, LacI family [Alicyclobacillus vulcanalis]